VAYDTETIFEVLGNVGASWAIYKNSALPSLTTLQFPRLLLHFPGHIRSFAKFKSDAHSGQLPRYSFLEPSFFFQPDDQHPPHDVSLGERFLGDIWTALSTGPHWKQTLLVITYDEHGGCYDHVPPPWGAAIPDIVSEAGPHGFRFNRFGLRVPAVVVSPLIEPGTVFRSPSGVPLDHTAVLATLRDWLHIPSTTMLPSRRIAAAPTLEFLLTRETPRTDHPAMPQPHQPLLQLSAVQEQAQPLNELQFSMVTAVESARRQRALTAEEIASLRQHVPTKAQVLAFFLGAGLLPTIPPASSSM
jgi:phospholipase C